MRGIKYLYLDNSQYTLTESKPQETQTMFPIDDLSVWKAILGNSCVEEVIESGIQIVIPFHNSESLETTINSILKSKVPTQIPIRINVVCSACTEHYIKIAQEICNKLGDNIQLIIQPKPGKPLALNTFLGQNEHPIVVQFVDDVTVSQNAIGLLVMALYAEKDFGASCVIGLPTNLQGQSLLKQVQRIYWDNFLSNQEYSLMGRAFAFRPNIIKNGFPEHIMSEDYWLEIQVREKSKGFIIVCDAYVEYYLPETWTNFMQQVDRFDGAFKQLKNSEKDLFLKHFGDVKNSIAFMLSPGMSKKPLTKALVAFVGNKGYTFTSKLIYFGIIMYQLYFLGIKSKIKPVKNANFKREESTLKA